MQRRIVEKVRIEITTPKTQRMQDKSALIDVLPLRRRHGPTQIKTEQKQESKGWIPVTIKLGVIISASGHSPKESRGKQYYKWSLVAAVEGRSSLVYFGFALGRGQVVQTAHITVELGIVIASFYDHRHRHGMAEDEGLLFRI